MEKLKNKKYPYAYLYVWATFICLLTVLAYICVNGGGALSRWLFSDTWDTGNDFFNCIPAVKGYGLGYWLLEQYPPLAKLFFLLMAHIYSYNNIPLNTTIRNSMTDPRMQQAALMPFIIFVLFTALIIVVIVDGMFKEEKQSVILGASIIGTHSVLFAIERGNIIFMSFMFLMYFVAYYQSDNKMLKETALISLALSAGLKYYPAGFGLLLIYERRWKEAIRTIIYGILALFIPNIIINQYLPQNDASNMANTLVEYGKVLLSRSFGARPLQQQIFFVISIVVALIGMIFIGIKGNRHWINVFYTGVFAIICGVMFTSSYAYVFLIPSLVLFLKEEKQVNLKNSFYFILLCLLNLPLPIFGLAAQSRVLFIKEVKLWTLFVMMILATLIEFSALRKAKKPRE